MSANPENIESSLVEFTDTAIPSPPGTKAGRPRRPSVRPTRWWWALSACMATLTLVIGILIGLRVGH
jgi:hypothetical protein